MLSVHTIAGRKLTDITPVTCNGAFEYRLENITYGKQPLVVTVTVDGARVSKVLMLR